MTPIDKIMQRIQARIGHRVQDRMSGEGATPWGEAWGLLTDPAEAIGKSSEPLDTFNDPNEASEGDAEMGAAKPAPASADAATPEEVRLRGPRRRRRRDARGSPLPVHG